MEGQLFKKKDITEALDTMVEGAQRRGGEDGDNISVVAYLKKSSKLALLHKVLMAIIAVLLIVALAIYAFQSDDKKPTPEPNATKTQELGDKNSSKDKANVNINDTNNKTSLVTLDKFEKKGV